jgi:4-oxalocrotonate tautomerase
MRRIETSATVAPAAQVVDFDGQQANGRNAMPLIEVKLYDRRINDEVVPAVIAKMTDAICDVIGEDVRAHTWVLVEGLSPKQWGIGGKPTDVTMPAQTPV